MSLWKSILRQIIGGAQGVTAIMGHLPCGKELLIGLGLNPNMHLISFLFLLFMEGFLAKK